MPRLLIEPRPYNLIRASPLLLPRAPLLHLSLRQHSPHSSPLRALSISETFSFFAIGFLLTSSTTTPDSRCSRGVSTEELVYEEENNNGGNATKVVVGAKTRNDNDKNLGGGEGDARSEKVKRREDGDGSVSSRYSVLLQLIACGSAGTELKGKQGPRLSDVGTKEREREKKSLFWEEGDSEIVNCVSENPRMLGNLQAEEKEYFSGSLVESMKANRVAFQGEPVLKKSNSYNEERFGFYFALVLFNFD